MTPAQQAARERVARAIYAVLDDNNDPWGAATERRKRLGAEGPSNNQQTALEAADAAIAAMPAPNSSPFDGLGAALDRAYTDPLPSILTSTPTDGVDQNAPLKIAPEPSDDPKVAELVERLKRQKFTRLMDSPRGTYDEPCDVDDYGAEASLINPDGKEAAAALTRLQERIAGLEAERDRKTAATCSCIEIHGEDPNCIKHGRGTAWSKANPDLCEIADRVKTAEAALAEAGEALEPFAGYMATAGSDLDNKGNPLPDENGVGWVYLTIGNFHRASEALARIRGVM